MAAPIPRVPPVTSARQPVNSFERSSLVRHGWSLSRAPIRLRAILQHASYNRVVSHILRPSRTEINRQIAGCVAFQTETNT